MLDETAQADRRITTAHTPSNHQSGGIPHRAPPFLVGVRLGEKVNATEGGKGALDELS